MAKKRKRKSPKGRRPKRRQARGSAWHWKQTDCWYYTQPGTKKRMPLVDENGNRIRGKDNKEAAQVALARVKLSQAMEMGQAGSDEQALKHLSVSNASDPASTWRGVQRQQRNQRRIHSDACGRLEVLPLRPCLSGKDRPSGDRRGFLAIAPKHQHSAGIRFYVVGNALPEDRRPRYDFAENRRCHLHTPRDRGMKTWCVNQHAADVSESFTKASHIGLGANVENVVGAKTSQQVFPHLAQCRTGVPSGPLVRSESGS